MRRLLGSNGVQKQEASRRPVDAPVLPKALAPQAGATEPALPPLGARIEHRPVEARELWTIEPHDPIWAQGALESGDSFAGTIVRLRPPAIASDGLIATVEQAVRQAGAVAVKVDARQHADVPAAQQNPDDDCDKHGIERRRCGCAFVAATFDEIVEAEVQRACGDVEPAHVREVVRDALEKGRNEAKPAIVPESSEPLHVAHVKAWNWTRFPSIDLALRPETYGVVARFEADADRSNGGGKSAFLATIPFALYGWHPYDFDEAWIRQDAKEGGVCITLSDGTTIERSKKRGASTKVVVVRADGRKIAGEEARAVIPRIVGLSEIDFFASSFVRQKELHRLVTGQSSETMEIVSGWLELSPIRAAHAHVLGKLLVASNNDEKLLREIASLAQERERLLADDVEDEIEAKIEKLQTKIVNLEREVRNARDVANAEEEVNKHVREHERIIFRQEQRDNWQRALTDLPRPEPLCQALKEAQEAHARAKAEANKARDELRMAEANGKQRQVVAAGEFDGRCPIADIRCPAQTQINERRTESRKELESAHMRARDASEVFATVRRIEESAASALRTAENALRDNNQNRERYRAELERSGTTGDNENVLQQAREALRQAIDKRGPPTSFGPECATASEQMASLVKLDIEARNEHVRLTKLRIALKGNTAARQVHEHARTEVIEDVQLYRAAGRVLGPGGVSKRWARAELARIERGANDLLVEAQAGLTVAIEWGWDSPTALAQACDGCGTGYAGGSRARTCPRCGAARAPKVEEKVRVALSWVSGAAEDLGGMAVQTSAAEWLWTERGSAWRTAVYDEPTSALDAALRRAFAAGLARKGMRRQAFVTAHHGSVIDALPARLEIVVAADGSSSISEVGRG